MGPFVGAGGWGYFNVPAADRLAAYAKAFPFVEVNATFYDHPDPGTVAAWRRKVPEAFAFSVRAHRDVAHRFHLRPSPAARASLARTAKIAERLRAIAIVLEAPATVRPEPRHLVDLVGATDLPCPIALEARAYVGRRLPEALAAAMGEHGIADALDFSRQAPRLESPLAYGRMFGPGEGNRWEFTADELAAIRQRGDAARADRTAFAFHGVRMYKDAGRFLTFMRTGRAPPSTRQVGLASLEEVLAEAASFPATKAALIRDHGFRVFDLPGGRQAHARELLDRLPAGPYASAGAVTAALEVGGRFG